MRPIETCTHRVQHVHGTPTAYFGPCACRCDDCRTVALRWAKRRRGYRTFIPAEHIHAHIADLLAAGMNAEQISRAAGMASGSTQQALAASKHIRETALAFLDVRLGVTAVGARRRLQALAAIGWTRGQIGTALGTTENAVSEVLFKNRAFISDGLGVRIQRAYEQMWEGPEVPNRHSVRTGRKHGFAPPLAWDDETIDDARVSPRGLIDSARSDLVADLFELAELGESWQQAMVRVGYENEDSLKRQLHRSGRYTEVRAAFGSVAA